MSQKKLMLLGGLRYLLPVIEEAHKLGVYVITADYLPNNIAHKYSDKYCNVSIIDKNAVLNAAQELKIDGILSHAVDPGVVSAAYVAEKMGLPFQCSYEAACILQDKSKFRTFLSENGFNCPKAKGYSDVNAALKDVDYFNWPVIVKPADSAGSKGVTKVENKIDLKIAIETALAASLSKHFVIEDFLDKVGAQSSADIFTIDGKLVYPAYSDQLFDKDAANPYTPAIEIWPASMEQKFQDDLTAQLQRLFLLLNVKSGIYNVESRVCSDGKAYIMEVSPRGGGNRIAELQDMATGQSLIRNEIRKALGMPMDDIVVPKYDGVWCNYILHSNKPGTFVSIDIDPDFQQKHVRNIGLIVKPGDEVVPFTGANNSLGTLFLRFENCEKLDSALSNISKKITINIR
ncbi:MAG: ATP-grasp domain-containing protein [Fibrobacter sp.]|uniref:ATP-grasp domain-containing protein n=1 Tax=Fibrobacter sp. TaxID=35828 RepID=UPI0025C2D876|nr:ATP-grasp domain-containing protein [Fibrobacter sp.]MBQ9226295.1 ATP-grasp domain-containing protein [Fibrobacter sp.]